MTTAIAERKATPADVFRSQLEKALPEFALALPPHIPPERFKRVVQTAVLGNPDLINADRLTLMQAAQKAAQDGLLPDGRDGALVVYRTKIKEKDDRGNDRERWINAVQWMPMIGGILKKVRNSGELLSIAAHVAYENDKFRYVLGDEELIEHEPALSNRGRPLLVYAIAKTKDGGIYREVMTVEDVEKVRAVSRAKDAGPWTQWWDEMARKTVLRRLAKRLPMSSDLDDLIRRDDALYEFDKNREDGPQPARIARSANPLADDDAGPVIDHDADGVVDHNPPGPQAGTPTGPQEGTQASPQARGHSAEFASQDEVIGADGTVLKSRDGEVGAKVEDLIAKARERGGEAARKGRLRNAPPAEYREPGREKELEAWFDEFDTVKAERAAAKNGGANEQA